VQSLPERGGSGFFIENDVVSGDDTLFPQQLPLGLLVVVLGVNAIMAYWMYRLGRRLPGGDARGAGTVDPESGTVECPACGAENELGYRYCSPVPANCRRPRRSARDRTARSGK